MKEKILVSGCLFGRNTKYNGKNNYVENIERLREKYDVVLTCPEVSGGLTIPRNPSEIRNNRVISNQGIDVTDNFQKGARIALELVKRHHIKKALLKESSPSCGSHYIYDGTFQNKKVNGTGITARLLMDNGVTVFNELEIDKLLKES